MADKKNTCYNCIHSGDNDNMNSAHIHKLFWRLDIVRVAKQQKKEMKTQSKRVV
jgi:hypothetical protein